ncbi:MAG: hypothetical protein DRI46_14455, partial [Chloroflexi bacterium]
KWLSLDDIGRIYGKQKAHKVKQTVSTEFPLGYDYLDTRPDTFGGPEELRPTVPIDNMEDYRKRVRVLERQYRVTENQEHFIDMETGDLSLIPEDMPKEKIQAILKEFNVQVIKRPADVIHWTVVAGDTVLHNSESPYKHFTIVPFFPIFRRGATIGMVENLIDPQELYNKARSQELHVINTSANSGWIKKRGSVLNLTTEELEERGAETGLVLDVTEVDDIKKITPNPIPTGLDRISQVAGEDLKEISMASDSMRGFDREDVAAKAIQAKQAVGGKNFAKVMDNLAHTRQLLAQRALTLWQTFYTTEREFQITGESLNAQTETVQINQPAPGPGGMEQVPGPGMGQSQPQPQPEPPPTGILNDITLGRYDVTVTTIPDRDTLQQSQLEQAIQLRELGVPIPDHVLIENSTLENKEELLDEKPDPQAEALRQAEVQEKQLANQKTEAETENVKSDTALNLVRAGRDAAETQAKEQEALNPPGSSTPQPDPTAVRQQISESRFKERELALREREHDDGMRFKASELDLKRADSKAKALIELRKLEKPAPASAKK